MKNLKGVIAAAMMLGSSSAMAALDLSLLGGASEFEALTKDLGAATSYKGVIPAEPLGLIIGIDVGLEASYTEFATPAWAQAIYGTNKAGFLLPRLHLHKGLPFNLDLGYVYIPEIKALNVSYQGGEVRWSPLDGGMVMPAMSVRLAYTQMNLNDQLFIKNSSVEVLASKGFLMFTPFAGAGLVQSNTDLQIPLTAFGVPDPTDTSITGNAKVMQTKLFAGMNVNLLALNFAAEWDMIGKTQSYSFKVGIRW